MRYSTARIDPNEPMYDGQERMSAAMAVLTGTPANAAKAPAVSKSSAHAPIASKATSRRHRPFRRAGQPGAQVTGSRTFRPGRQIVGGTRFYQPKSRMTDQFRDSARRPVQRDVRMADALLKAASRRTRTPVPNHAQELDRVRSRAMAQQTVDTLRYRWLMVNRPDLGDGIANAHHLRRNARNYNRDNKPDATMATVLMFG